MVNIEVLIKHLNLFDHSVTIVDIDAPDQPLIYVNDHFCILTGYPRNEIIGKNCRFLQGKNTNKEDVKNISKFISEKRAFFCDLLNYKKNGTEFYNRLILLPLESEDKFYYMGFQTCSNDLIKSFEEDFCVHKKSQEIKELIEVPLMKLISHLSNGESVGSKNLKSEKVKELLFEILSVVLTI